MNLKNKTRAVLLPLFLSFIEIGGASGQIGGSNAISASVSEPTSNASALGKYGGTPMNLYTGQPNISVPLYKVAYNDIEIPLSLNYDASGIRVDQYPTWVGLGFHLDAGGVITRSVQGMPDDYYFPDNDNYKNTEKGYLFCGGKLNLPGNDWYSYSTLSTFGFYGTIGNWNPDYLADGCPDDFNFNVGGFSGSFFLDETGQWRVRSKADLGLEVSHEISDEFVFEDCTSFESMKIHKPITKFVLTAPDGKKYTFGGDRNSMEYSRALKDDFRRFNGNNHTFNIVPTAWYLTKIETPTGDVANLSYDRGLNLIRHSRSVSGYSYRPDGSSTNNSHNDVALHTSILTPCYLASIETPKQIINFYRSYTTEMTYSSLGVSWEVPSQYGTIYEPLELYETQMFNLNIGPMDDVNQFRAWPDFSCPKYTSGVANPRPRPGSNSNKRIPNWQYKLDSFHVIDKVDQEKVLRAGFAYTDSESLRLFLNKVVTYTNGNTSEHSFDYDNPSLVPNYNVLQKDQWGYYNGINYSMVMVTDMYDPALWRLPVAGLTRYGTLNKITYPTGGTTEFEYELNNYSAYQAVTQTHAAAYTGHTSLVPQNTNTDAGGLRIKKIRTSANFNSPQIVKEYFYSKDYVNGGQLSSGVLSGVNRYIEETYSYNPCYAVFGSNTLKSDNAFLPWGENDAKGVAYSEVTEKNGDGSFTVYKYSNYDSPNGLDEYHLDPLIVNAMVSMDYQLSSNGIERGLLLEEANYNGSGLKVADKVYEYEFAANRKEKFAKGIRRRDNLKVTLIPALYWGDPICVKQAVIRLFPYKKYYYNIPLKKTTETDYDVTGAVSRTSEFAYDGYGNVATRITNTSDGRRLLHYTKYNSHPDYLGTALTNDALGIKNLFTNYRIKNYPVEEVTVLSPQQSTPPYTVAEDRILGANLLQYKHDRPVPARTWSLELSGPLPLYVPVNGSLVQNFTNSSVSNGNLVKDGRYKLQREVSAFTSYPNSIFPRATGVTDGIGNSAYTWDHYAQYQTSATKNALAHEVAFSSFEGVYVASGASDDNRGNWEFKNEDIITGGLTGKRALRLSYPEGDFIRTINTLATGKKYYVSFWAKGTAQPQVKLGSAAPLNVLLTPLRVAGEWRFYRHEITGTGAQLSLVPDIIGQANSVDIDEVRLYPVSATMSSYNYDPSLGNITSVSDGRDNITFYEYDGQGRLLLVRDEKGNILKKHTYKINGAQ